MRLLRSGLWRPWLFIFSIVSRFGAGAWCCILMYVIGGCYQQGDIFVQGNKAGSFLAIVINAMGARYGCGEPFPEHRLYFMLVVVPAEFGDDPEWILHIFTGTDLCLHNCDHLFSEIVPGLRSDEKIRPAGCRSNLLESQSGAPGVSLILLSISA